MRVRDIKKRGSIYFEVLKFRFSNRNSFIYRKLAFDDDDVDVPFK